MDDLAAHERAQRAFTDVLARVRPDQLVDPSTCTDWTVRDVILHVIHGNQRVAGAVAAATADEAGSDDLLAAHAASAAAAQEVFSAPDGMTRMFDVPFGTIPGSVLVGLRTTDALVHAWDLAKATGQSTDLDRDVAEQMLAMSRQRIRPEFRGPGRPFDEEQPCDAGRPVADQLAAFLGRRVD